MLENLVNPRVRLMEPKGDVIRNNLMGADNQQERTETVGWVVGFVDGEGCFSVTLIRNSTTRTGWQVFPEFVVTQGQSSISALLFLKSWFGCGEVYVNRRSDNHREPLARYCVRALDALRTKVVPFFEKHPLKTKKREDFKKFAQVLEWMSEKKHLSKDGLREIAGVAQTMNRRKSARFLESSETVRLTP